MSISYIFYYIYIDYLNLQSFPTRRSSDLIKQELLLLVYELNRSGLLDRSSDLIKQELLLLVYELNRSGLLRSEERFSRNAETELVCRLLLEKKKISRSTCIIYS